MRITLIHLRLRQLVQDREEDPVECGGEGGQVAGEELRGEEESLEVGYRTLTDLGAAVDALFPDDKERR